MIKNQRSFFKQLSSVLWSRLVGHWWGRVALGLALGIGILMTLNQADEDVQLVEKPLSVQAACELLYNQQGVSLDTASTKTFTLILSLPDGTPIPGVCLTFMQDMGPGVSPVLIGTCTTDVDGRCSVEATEGIINVRFGNTLLGGIPVDSSAFARNIYLSDASVGGINFFFIGDSSDQNIVANIDEDGNIVDMEHARQDENGNLVPVGGVETDWGLPPNIDINLPPVLNTDPPRGIVVVRFFPLILRTTETYSRVYCYYSTRGSGFARVPRSPGTFIPGSGTYFDLSLVMNGQATPAQILNADTDTFDIATHCWGWQGTRLKEIGTGVASIRSEQWVNEILTIQGNGYALNYTLRWYGQETEPNSSVLPVPADGEDYISISDERFTTDIPAPTNINLNQNVLQWSYHAADATAIGGFRLYRNNYLIASISSSARAWTGDGIYVGECGTDTEYRLTAFAGGLESVPSSAFVVAGTPCAAHITVQLNSLSIQSLLDCDGDACGTSSEAYGYFNVNGELIAFGRQPISPQYIGLNSNSNYDFASILSPFNAANSIVADVSSEDPLNIEMVLFDHDANTSDDLLCSWSRILPPQEAEAWLNQDGLVIASPAEAGEGNCTIQVSLEISVQD